MFTYVLMHGSTVSQRTVETTTPIHVLSVLTLLVQHRETDCSRLVVVRDFFTLRMGMWAKCR